MEMAKVTSKGQITIPVSIRRLLNINEGDKLLFIEKPDGVMIVNPDTFQMERFDELPAIPPSGSDDQYAAAMSKTGSRADNKPYNPPEKNGDTNRNPSGFDVAALLNDIRSMGSKI